MTLTTGIHGEQSVTVTNENTAKTMKRHAGREDLLDERGRGSG